MIDPTYEPLVFDTCVLSNFAIVGRLDLLCEAGASRFVTKEVYAEIVDGINYHQNKNVQKVEYLSQIVQSIENNNFVLFSPSSEQFDLINELSAIGALNKGEISSMVLAKQKGAVFVTDERRATNEAIRRSIKVLDLKNYKGTVLLSDFFLGSKIINDSEYSRIRQLLKENRYEF